MKFLFPRGDGKSLLHLERIGELMSMLDWAKREVELACKRENPDRKPDEWDYGCACYESALKAYESLINDGHSGMSWGLTKNILIRLMNSQCLTPIEDVPEVWNVIDSSASKTTYQSKRMSSLFKDVYSDGSIRYEDIDRVVCYEIGKPYGFVSGFIRDIIDELYPIEMPYYPAEKPYRVYVEDFISDPKNADFDHQALFYLITPEGEKIQLDKYYDLSGDETVEISKEEYYKRKEKTK